MNDIDTDSYERLREWTEVLEDASYYEILGVLELADDQAIQQAFHDFALSFHPDAHIDAPPEVLEAVRFIFRRGVEAYRTLSDPVKRSRYDLAVARGELRLLDRPSGRPGPLAAKSLVDVCRSPAAKLHAGRADEHISAGDLTAARRELNEALAQDDYDNAELEERIEALDLAAFASGG